MNLDNAAESFSTSVHSEAGSWTSEQSILTLFIRYIRNAAIVQAELQPAWLLVVHCGTKLTRATHRMASDDAEEWSEDHDAEEWSEDHDAEEWSQCHHSATSSKNDLVRRLPLRSFVDSWLSANRRPQVVGNELDWRARLSVMNSQESWGPYFMLTESRGING